MYAAAVPVALVYYFIWNPPALSQFALFVYLTVLATLVRVFVSAYETPSTAIVAELTEDYDERTRLLSLRYLFGWAGGLTMAFLMWHYLMVEFGVTGHTTYETYGLVGSVAMLLAIVVGRRVAPRDSAPAPTAAAPAFSLGTVLRQIGVTLSNRNFLALFMAGLFASIGAGVATNFDTFINTHFWEFTPDQVSWIVLALFASAVLAARISTVRHATLRQARHRARFYAVSIVWGAAPVVLRLLDSSRRITRRGCSR